MSTDEIIAELEKLPPEDLQRVKSRMEELEANGGGEKPMAGEESLGEFLLKFAGTFNDLPSDMSVNHDHYLYGVPKRK